MAQKRGRGRNARLPDAGIARGGQPSYEHPYDRAFRESGWPHEVFMSPKVNRPWGARDFLIKETIALNGAVGVVCVLDTLGADEGALLSLKVEEAAPAALALANMTARLISPSQLQDVHGGALGTGLPFGGNIAIDEDDFLFWLAKDSRIQIEITVPAGARTVVSTVRGWKAPVQGVGAISSGTIQPR